MRLVRHIMGMPVTLDIPVCDDLAIFEAVFSRLTEIDHKYSPYKPDSELHKVWKSGKIPESDTEMLGIESACRTYTKLTEGYFSAYFNKRFDPTGYVKGWAIKESCNIIERNGFDKYLLIISGDMSLSSNDEAWEIGIQNPFDKQSLISTVSLNHAGIATSGDYENNDHIVNPHDHQSKSDLISVTVIGKDIIDADVYATALFAMGLDKGLDYAKSNLKDYETLFITKDGNMYPSSNTFKFKTKNAQ